MIRFRTYIPQIPTSEDKTLNSNNRNGLFVPSDELLELNRGLFSTYPYVLNQNRINRSISNQDNSTIKGETIPGLSKAIPSEIIAPIFVPDRLFSNLMERFRSKYDKSFPEFPCSYCGVLLLQRSIKWIKRSIGMEYPLTSTFGYEVIVKERNGIEFIAVCYSCNIKPRLPPNSGPWPVELIELPQRSRIFLSPVSLQTNLGRTQSYNQSHNPYSTYRTLTGKMNLTRNRRAIALYTGCIGAYLESSKNRFDEGHDLELLNRAKRWLLEHNSLFQRYDVRRELGLDVFPTVTVFSGDVSSTQQQMPWNRPDIVLNPYDYPVSTTGEDYRYYRLPVGSVPTETANGNERLTINRSNPIIEPLLFPVLYPWGKGQYIRQSNYNVPFKQTMLVDAKIKLNSVIPYYRDDHYWSSWIYMEIEAIRIFQNNCRIMKNQKERTDHHRQTAAEILQQSQYGPWMIINEQLTTSIPKFIRTGDTFFLNAESNVRCMLQTFGIPTIFVTTTFSERWPEYIKILSRTGNQDILPSNRPWDAVQYYYERWHWLKSSYFKGVSVSGFGQLKEIVERHEFQLRGAIHTHSLLWCEKNQEELIENNFIRANISDPEKEPELYRLVIENQIHRCSVNLCGKEDSNMNGICRKGFPADISIYTFRKPNEIRYTYQRLKEDDRFVVPYSPRLLLLWKAHCNVQYCTTGGLAKYITKYVTKSEPKSVVTPNNTKKISDHILARRMGSMENMVLLLSFPIFQMSSSTLYLPTSVPSDRAAIVKPSWLLVSNPDSEDIFYADTIEKYYKRPQSEEFEFLTYFKYHSMYKIQRRQRSNSSTCSLDGCGNYVYGRNKVRFY